MGLTSNIERTVDRLNQEFTLGSKRAWTKQCAVNNLVCPGYLLYQNSVNIDRFAAQQWAELPSIWMLKYV